jgi:MFS family permease
VSALRRQLGVLNRSSGFRLLFLASMGSMLGTLLATVALVVDVKDRTNSGPWVSALLFVEFLPAVVVGLALGPLLDRLSRRRTMIAADLVRVAVFCALPFVHSAAAIVALAGAAGVATGFFRPAAYAGLPNLVGEEDLPAANSILQSGENISWAIGPVIGGLLVAAAGPHPAYWLNAASFLLSAALLAGIPARLLQAALAESHGHLRDLGEGFRFVMRTRMLRGVLVAWALVLGAIGVLNTAQVFLAKDSLHGGDFGYGLLFGAIGLGLAIGSLGAGSLVEHRPLSLVYGGGITLHGMGFLFAAISPSIWVAAACCVLGGIGNGAALFCNALLVQRSAPDELRGRVFTILMSVTYVALGVGVVIAGPLCNDFSARWIYGGAAVTLICTGFVAFLLVRSTSVAGAGDPEPAT